MAGSTFDGLELSSKQSISSVENESAGTDRAEQLKTNASKAATASTTSTLKTVMDLFYPFKSCHNPALVYDLMPQLQEKVDETITESGEVDALHTEAGALENIEDGRRNSKRKSTHSPSCSLSDINMNESSGSEGSLDSFTTLEDASEDRMRKSLTTFTSWRGRSYLFKTFTRKTSTKTKKKKVRKVSHIDDEKRVEKASHKTKESKKQQDQQKDKEKEELEQLRKAEQLSLGQLDVADEEYLSSERHECIKSLRDTPCGEWQRKTLVSERRHCMEAEVLFASKDQRSEGIDGVGACAVTASSITEWIHEQTQLACEAYTDKDLNAEDNIDDMINAVNEGDKRAKDPVQDPIDCDCIRYRLASDTFVATMLYGARQWHCLC